MARTKYYNPTTQLWEYADSNPLPTGTADGDILVNENGVWVSKPKWQMIYQPVEYIQSSENQRIDTGVYLNSRTRMVVESSMTYTASSFKVAGIMSWDSTYQGVCCYGNVQQHAGYLSVIYKSFVLSSGASENDWIHTTVQNDGQKHTIDLQNGSQKVDNVEFGTDTINGAFNSVFDISLFARHNNTTSYSPYIAEKIYSAKFYDGDTLIRDYIPVYNIYTGEAGLYDKVNNLFYGNKGSGTFTKGADVN